MLNCVEMCNFSPHFHAVQHYFVLDLLFSGEILGGLKQKHKKQPFGDASASHLSLVLWHV